MERTIPKRITVGEILRLRKCLEQDRFAKMNFPSHYLEHRSMIGDVLEKASTALKNEEPETVIEEKAVKGLEEWYRDFKGYDSVFEKENAFEKDKARLIRLIRYLCGKNGHVVAVNECFFIDMPHTSYGGVKFDAIGGRADIVFRDARGEYEAISFVQENTEYSYRARKECNRPENSIELLALKIGLEKKYPGVTCSLYHLRNKDDKPGKYQSYENRAGKNIISWSFSDKSEKELRTLLSVAVTLPVDCKCESCAFQDVCRFPKELRIAEEMKKEGVSEKKTSYTEAQKQVIFHQDGPMNVIAVPGAGKTFSLVQRMKYLMDQGVPPKKILFVTFTKKACKEIEERVKREMGEDTNLLPDILTFNALGYKILRDNPALVGKRVTLAEKKEKKAVIREVLQSVPQISGVSYEGIYGKYGLIEKLENEFSKIGSLGMDQWAENFNGDCEGFKNAYREYQRILQAKGSIDYEEQISLCNQLFESHPRLTELYSKIYQYIMVDEFQDVSEQNVRLIYSIAKHHGNIVVVGDDDQSIYSFRGGSNRFMLEFPDAFPDAKTVIMNDNFRSNDKILNAAETLIRENTERCEKSFVAHKEEDYAPLLYRNFNQQKLVKLVQLILKKGCQPGEIAILARNNKTLFEVESNLSTIVPVLPPKDYIVKDAVFYAVYDMLCIYFGKKDQFDKSLYRILCYLGLEDELKSEKAGRRGETFSSSLFARKGLKALEVGNEESASFYRDALAKEGICHAMGLIYNTMVCMRYAQNLQEALEAITAGIFGMQSHRVCDILLEKAEERAIVTVEGLFSWMQDMVLFGDETRVGYGAQKNAVNLLTAHDAKGKEFPIVIVYASEEFHGNAEERRLLYVAMTRAEKSLFVTETEFQKAEFLTDDLLKQMIVC